MKTVKNYLTGVQNLVAAIDQTGVDNVVSLLWDNFVGSRRVVFCGNGGSAATASHLPADFQKGLYLQGARPWECFSVVDSIPLLTAWGNDTEYANIFAAQVRCWIRPNDLLIAISGSGNSPNILGAVRAANEIGAVTVGWSGFGGGQLAEIAQHNVIVPSDNMQMVEDAHMIIGHAVYTAMRDRLIAETAAIL